MSRKLGFQQTRCLNIVCSLSQIHVVCDRRVVMHELWHCFVLSLAYHHDSTYHLLGSQRTLHLTHLDNSLLCGFHRLDLFRVILISCHTAPISIYERPGRQGIWCAPCKRRSFRPARQVFFQGWEYNILSTTIFDHMRRRSPFYSRSTTPSTASTDISSHTIQHTSLLGSTGLEFASMKPHPL